MNEIPADSKTAPAATVPTQAVSTVRTPRVPVATTWISAAPGTWRVAYLTDRRQSAVSPIVRVQSDLLVGVVYACVFLWSFGSSLCVR